MVGCGPICRLARVEEGDDGGGLSDGGDGACLQGDVEDGREVV